MVSDHQHGRQRRSFSFEKIAFVICMMYCVYAMMKNNHFLSMYGNQKDLGSKSQQTRFFDGREEILAKQEGHLLQLRKGVQEAKEMLEEKRKENAKNEKLRNAKPKEAKQEKHKIAGLSCKKHHTAGSIQQDDAMVYWSDIESDSEFVSPFYDEEKYLTFEPDHGGWNNIRMSMETVLVLAHAMGRTLVLPPEAPMYLLMNGKKGHKTKFTFNDFFHLDSVSTEHKGINIITMTEFLTKNQNSFTKKNSEGIEVPYPLPENRLNWDGQRPRELYNYFEKVAKVPKWDPNKCMAVFPSTSGKKDVQNLKDIMGQIVAGATIPDPFSYTGNPVEVNATITDRLKENLSQRKELCIYDTEMQNSKFIHFSQNTDVGARMLIHFYGFVLFEDWKQDLWSKRFVRDHIRYNDEIMCAASRIIQAIRERAQQNDPNNKNGDFDAMHIRRGDFQYHNVKIEEKAILTISDEHLTAGSTLYISTDEKEKDTFFTNTKEKYDVVFLDDFHHLIPDLNLNYYGMLEQIICSHSRVFYGTWFSTFSGYINRMRGYLSTKKKMDGYKDGILKSWYFVPEFRRYEMQKYHAVRQPFYMREFPTSWRNIDMSVS